MNAGGGGFQICFGSGSDTVAHGIWLASLFPQEYKFKAYAALAVSYIQL